MNPNTIKEDEHEEFGNEFGTLPQLRILRVCCECSRAICGRCSRTVRSDPCALRTCSKHNWRAPGADQLGKA